MKKTKKPTKRPLIILAIIVVAIGACLLITKACISQKQSNKETIQNNGDLRTTTQNAKITMEIVSPQEEPKNEERNYAPAEIKNVFQKDSTTYLTLDMLTINKDFKPGATDFFINQNPKIRDISINKNTKAYDCGAGPDKNITTPDVSVPVATVISSIQQQLTGNNGPVTYYFDISKNTIKTIYQQCLP